MGGVVATELYRNLRLGTHSPFVVAVLGDLVEPGKGLAGFGTEGQLFLASIGEAQGVYNSRFARTTTADQCIEVRVEWQRGWLTAPHVSGVTNLD
ncbi:hypothetical protein FQZ97_1242310 [compost metagenome]